MRLINGKIKNIHTYDVVCKSSQSKGGKKISVAGNIISLNNIDFSASPHG